MQFVFETFILSKGDNTLALHTKKICNMYICLQVTYMLLEEKLKIRKIQGWLMIRQLTLKCLLKNKIRG